MSRRWCRGVMNESKGFINTLGERHWAGTNAQDPLKESKRFIVQRGKEKRHGGRERTGEESGIKCTIIASSAFLNTTY